MTSDKYIDVLKPCWTCDEINRCPKIILPDTIKCEVFKLSCAMDEAKHTIREEVMKYKPSWRTIYIAAYIAGVVSGILLLLAFQGKLG
jgi:hypothetical protein